MLCHELAHTIPSLLDRFASDQLRFAFSDLPRNIGFSLLQHIKNSFW
jgi:hypothetical protein